MAIIPVNYGVYPHIDRVQLATVAASDANFLNALQHRSKISGIDDRVKSEELSVVEGARLCVKECDEGIDRLKTGSALGTNLVLVVLAELRERRAYYLNIVIEDDFKKGTASPSDMEARSQRQFEDATAVVDLAGGDKATPAMVRSARASRMGSYALRGSLGIVSNDRERKIVLEDAKTQGVDPEATAGQRAFADKVALDLNSASPAPPGDTLDSVKACFLTHADLCRVDGLNFGKPECRHFISRTYMDKDRPVSMNDGTPKPLPPGLDRIDSIVHMTPSNLMSTYGKKGGAFFGEDVFWKRHNGLLLGKHKWEAPGQMDTDTATCSEVWDMRWVMKTHTDAKSFFRDMLEMCRLADNNGLMDGMDELAVKSHERSEVDGRVEDLVFCGNKPKKRPGSNNMQGRMTMSMTPTLYLQQYTALFVVGRCVVKLYIIEGYNPTQGKLPRSAMFGPKGLINVAAGVVSEWLDGQRTEFDQRIVGDVQWGDVSRCARCGAEGDNLKRCSRCKKVAYCSRDCQVAHFPEHKAPCKRAARAAAN